MSNFRNKINNNKKKRKENEAINELVELKKKMKEQYAAGEYVEAMDTMAEIARHKKMDPEIMYMGANCYFMTGDYERAARWVNSTLSYDPQNISARLLLSRLCFVEEKPDDGFVILNFVVENFSGSIKEEEKTRLLEMLGYCNEKMADTMKQYPALMEYFKANYVAPVAPTQKVGDNSIQDKLEAFLSPKNTVDNAHYEESKSKAQAAVDRLKLLLNKSKGNKYNDEKKPALDNGPKTKLTRTTEMDGGDSSEQLIDKVMASAISLREKIKGLNNFASGLFLNDDYDGAFKLLQKALEIDAHDPFVLRNMAYVCLAMKDKDKALEYASKLPMMDFGLIKAIKVHCHE